MEFRVHYAKYPLCAVLLIRLIKIDADSSAVWRFEVLGPHTAREFGRVLAVKDILIRAIV